jgi:hypothetical protein
LGDAYARGVHCGRSTAAGGGVLGSLIAAVALMAPGSCPAHGTLPANHWARTRTEMLPRGAVRLRLCRYAPRHDSQVLFLRRQALVTRRSTIGAIAREADTLPMLHGPTACPADFRTEILIRAAYPSGHQASLSVGLTGCQLVTNDHLHRTALSGSGPTLLRHLQTLAG